MSRDARRTGPPDLARWSALVALIAIAIGVSAASLWNGFAGDDIYIIVQNPRVHDLSAVWQSFREGYWPLQFGGMLYRPATVLGYAFQWQLGGSSPAPFHAVNLLLLAATTAAVWLLGQSLLPAPAAWFAAAFFAVHPVHVEAVANVVGQPEVLVTLLQVTAVIWYLSARRKGSLAAGQILGITALYACACLAKESGVVLPALLVLAEVTLVASDEPATHRLAKLAPFFGALALVGAGYLITRSLVLGGLVGEYPNPAIRGVGFGTRLLTMLAVVPQWWRLLLLPWHLQADYMPVELDRATTFGPAQALGLLVLVGWALAGWKARRAYPVTSFGLGWVAVTLFPVSNLFLPSGILLAERTLFSPSVGACLAVGGIAPWLGSRVSAARRWERGVFAGFLFSLLLAWAVRTATRIPVWKDDAVLARQTVLDAPLSYRAHAVLGGVLFQEGDPGAGEREYRIAIALYPNDPNVFAGLAKRYRDLGLHAPAIPLFRQALELAPQMVPARNMLIYSLTQIGDSVGAAAEFAEKVRRADPDTARLRMVLDSLWQARRAPPASGQ